MVQRLKQLRMEKGISQQSLAAVLGLTQQSINKYENHRVEPDIATLIRMAGFFEVSIDYLVGRTDQPTMDSSQTARLSSQEEKLVKGFRSINETEKVCVLTLIETYNALK